MILYRELHSVEKDLGIPAKTLYAVSNSVYDRYHTVLIPKKDGGTRKLTVPDPILKKIQRSVKENLLDHYAISPYATAYAYGSSVGKNARPHVGQKTVLKLDIDDFFGSILYTQVKDIVFPADVFSEPIRVLLSILCYYRDELPQGAPTSPAIANIVLFDFDMEIGEYCREKGVVYTRYCDDMTFSGEDFDVGDVIGKVRKELRKYGFFLKDKKTCVVRDGRRKTVTGVVVNEKLSALRPYRKQLRQEIYYCEKYGLEDCATRRGTDAFSYGNSLLGKVGYALSLDPANVELRALQTTVRAQLSAL